MITELIIYGTGGAGREVAWLAQRAHWNVLAFVDDFNHGDYVNDLPVLSLPEAQQQHQNTPMIVSVGNPQVREKLVRKALEAGFRFAPPLVDPTVAISPSISIGNGTTISAGCVLTVNITIGQHVQINHGCIITHDDILEDFATLALGVHLCGMVHVGERAYIGSGAVVRQGSPHQPVCIENDVIVGAGAVVLQSIPQAVTALGIPARW